MRDEATFRVKAGLAEMLKGGVIMDVVDAEQAKIAEDAGAAAVMALERVPAAPTAAAVFAYRVILFWLPLTLGGIAFAQLRRGLEDPARADLCDPLRRPRRARRGRDPVAT